MQEQDIWTVRRILLWIEDYLGKHGDENPRVSAQWLVGDALDMTRMELLIDPDRPLTSDERAVLRDYTRRRAAGEPLQYITGTTDFRYITVKVEPGVLIPRPETEVLVSEALAMIPAPPRPQDAADRRMAAELYELNGRQQPEGAEASTEGERAELLVADLCTGTGCIACSIAHEHPHVRVVATDIAPEAVALARQNAESLGLSERVDVFECDLGEAVDESLYGAFDLVVSNPPYVPTDVLGAIPDEVSDYEPSLALDGGEDGLSIYRRILAWSRKALKPGGGLAVELHETRLEDAAAEAEYAGFADVRVHDDLAGRPRVLTARNR